MGTLDHFLPRIKVPWWTDVGPGPSPLPRKRIGSSPQQQNPVLVAAVAKSAGSVAGLGSFVLVFVFSLTNFQIFLLDVLKHQHCVTGYTLYFISLDVL